MVVSGGGGGGNFPIHGGTMKICSEEELKDLA